VPVGPGVLAAVLARFIRMKQMMVDGDVLINLTDPEVTDALLDIFLR
jgi:hypothetical protein